MSREAEASRHASGSSPYPGPRNGKRERRTRAEATHNKARDLPEDLPSDRSVIWKGWVDSGRRERRDGSDRERAQADRGRGGNRRRLGHGGLLARDAPGGDHHSVEE